jgi:hypothetical protein
MNDNMKNVIVDIENPKDNPYPEGLYEGIASGWIVTSPSLGVSFDTNMGVRGVNVECLVTVTDDRIIINIL